MSFVFVKRSARDERPAKRVADAPPQLRMEQLESRLTPAVALTDVNSSFLGAGNGNSQMLAITPSGRFAIFASTANDIIPQQNDIPGTKDLYWIDFVTGFQGVELALTLGVELLEAAFEGTDDFQDLVTDRGRIDFDVGVHGSQLAEQSLRDLAVGRDDDLTGLGVHHVQRDLFAEENVGETLGEVVRQLVSLLLVLVVALLLFGRGKISELMGDLAKGIKTFKKGLIDEDWTAGRRSAAIEDRDVNTMKPLE